MVGFSKKIIERDDNVYTVLNKELERLYALLDRSMKGGNKDNTTVFWNKIKELQAEMVKALEKQPANSQDIKDLQDTVAEILLLTDTDSK